MLDDLLGRGLPSKCKSYIKIVSSRLELIKRKRNSKLRFLRKDVADLLSGISMNFHWVTIRVGHPTENLLMVVKEDHTRSCMSEDLHYERKEYEHLSQRGPSSFPSNENEENLSQMRKSPYGSDPLHAKMRGETDYRDDDDETHTYRSRSPSLYAGHHDRNLEEIVYGKNNHVSPNRRESFVDHVTKFEEVRNREMSREFNVPKISQNTYRRQVADNLNNTTGMNLKPPPYVLAKDRRSPHNYGDENGVPSPIEYAEGKDPDSNTFPRPLPHVISKNQYKYDAEVEMEGSNGEEGEFVEDGRSDCRPSKTRVVDFRKLGDKLSMLKCHDHDCVELDSTTLTNRTRKPKSVRQMHLRPTHVDTEFNESLPQNEKKHDAYDLSRMTLDQLRNNDHEPTDSENRNKEWEHAAPHANSSGSLVDQPRPNADHVHRPRADAGEEEVFMAELLLHYSKKETPQVVNIVQVGTRSPSHYSGGVDGVDTPVDSAKRGERNPQPEFSRAHYRVVSLPLLEPPKPKERFQGHCRAGSL